MSSQLVFKFMRPTALTTYSQQAHLAHAKQCKISERRNWWKVDVKIISFSHSTFGLRQGEKNMRQGEGNRTGVTKEWQGTLKIGLAYSPKVCLKT